MTVGIDLAAMPDKTAIATVAWDGPGARLLHAHLGADDNEILRAVVGAGKVGIDCPLGWPDAFVEFLVAYKSGNVAATSGAGGPAWRQQLVNRRTDLFVRDVVGLKPLSVGADRIAHVALRCTALLAKLEAAGIPVDRAGRGVVVEVYPKASLKRWNLLPEQSYKQSAHSGTLTAAVANLTSAAPWLDLGSCATAVSHTHDVFDSLIAALTARAAFKGLTCVPAEIARDAAATEG